MTTGFQKQIQDLIPLYQSCQTCRERFPVSRLCVNERTGVRECGECYLAWRRRINSPLRKV